MAGVDDEVLDDEDNVSQKEGVIDGDTDNSFVEYDSDSESDGVQGRSTSSRSQPFILSNCTIPKRKRNTSICNVNIIHQPRLVCHLPRPNAIV